MSQEEGTLESVRLPKNLTDVISNDNLLENSIKFNTIPSQKLTNTLSLGFFNDPVKSAREIEIVNLEGSGDVNIDTLSSAIIKIASAEYTLNQKLNKEQKERFDGFLDNLKGALSIIQSKTFTRIADATLILAIAAGCSPIFGGKNYGIDQVNQPVVQPANNEAESKGEQRLNMPEIYWIPTEGGANEKMFQQAQDPNLNWDVSSYAIKDAQNGIYTVGFGRTISAEVKANENGSITLTTNIPSKENFNLTQEQVSSSQFKCTNQGGQEIQCVIDPQILLTATEKFRNAQKIEMLLFTQTFLDVNKKDLGQSKSITTAEATQQGIKFLEPAQINPAEPNPNPNQFAPQQDIAQRGWRDVYFIKVTYGDGRIEYNTAVIAGQTGETGNY